MSTVVIILSGIIIGGIIFFSIYKEVARRVEETRQPKISEWIISPDIILPTSNCQVSVEYKLEHYSWDTEPELIVSNLYDDNGEKTAVERHKHAYFKSSFPGNSYIFSNEENNENYGIPGTYKFQLKIDGKLEKEHIVKLLDCINGREDSIKTSYNVFPGTNLGTRTSVSVKFTVTMSNLPFHTKTNEFLMGICTKYTVLRGIKFLDLGEATLQTSDNQQLMISIFDSNNSNKRLIGERHEISLGEKLQLDPPIPIEEGMTIEYIALIYRSNPDIKIEYYYGEI